MQQRSSGRLKRKTSGPYLERKRSSAGSTGITPLLDAAHVGAQLEWSERGAASSVLVPCSSSDVTDAQNEDRPPHVVDAAPLQLTARPPTAAGRRKSLRASMVTSLESTDDGAPGSEVVQAWAVGGESSEAPPSAGRRSVKVPPTPRNSQAISLVEASGSMSLSLVPVGAHPKACGSAQVPPTPRNSLVPTVDCEGRRDTIVAVAIAHARPAAPVEAAPPPPPEIATRSRAQTMLPAGASFPPPPQDKRDIKAGKASVSLADRFPKPPSHFPNAGALALAAAGRSRGTTMG